MFEPLPTHWTEKLIQKMHILYGAKFAQQWESVPRETMVQAWAEELAGFTGEELATGLAACKQKTFPPTLPEFMKLCRPWMDPEVAFHEAVTGMQDRAKGEKGNWSHPAIFYAATTIGAYDLLNNGYQVLKTRWTNALEFQLKQQNWKPIPEPMPALPAPVEKADQNIQAQAMGAIAHVRRDPRAWARKILDNQKGKSPAVIAMAQRALENVA